jgi:phage terminase large subunit-like protein
MNTRLDETAIAIVAVGREGWWVRDVVCGRWDVRETSIRILHEAKRHHVISVGIEQGMARNAILPYLTDQMRRLGQYPHLVEVKHGGQNKASRIAWALQGRMEHGRIQFARGDYLPKLREQIHDFPFGRHDDMVDALAYIDQIATIAYREDWVEDTWAPMDEAVGL